MGVQRRIADIQPFAELAQGRTTVVYKGYQHALDRFVLLKVLRREVSYDEELARRFEEEARLVAQIQHPNVVSVYAYGREDGQSYLAAEFIEGMDLRGLLAQGPLPVELAVFILTEVAKGLQAAHRRGILHRDLKPSNILIAYDGHVKLTDFGLASLVQEEAAPEVRGTPGYLAPEQIRGTPPAVAADLFSLGATFFEMLTGRPAFTGADTSTLLDAVLHYDPLPTLDRFTEVPESLRAICVRLLAKDPAQRYAHVDTLIEDLANFRSVSAIEAGAAALQAYQDDPGQYRSTARSLVAALPEPLPASPGRKLHPRMRYVAGFVLAALTLAVLVASGMLLESKETSDGIPLVSRQEVDTLSHPDVFLESPTTLAPTETERETTLSEAQQADENSQAKLEQGLPAPSNIPPAQQQREPLLGLDTTLTTRTANKEVGGTGMLRVVAGPWATVFIDGDSVGTTPLSRTILAGSHRVSLKNPLFPEYSTQVEVEAGKEQTLSVSLWAQVGQLSLAVSPWADVFINGKLRDTTPLDRPLILIPGVHTLSLRHRDLGAWDTTLTIKAGEEQSLRINLSRLLGR